MSLKQKIILMQGGKSIKTDSWSEVAKKQNLGILKVISGTPMKMFFVLVKNIVEGRKPNALIFRYLNDHKSLILTILRTLLELFTIIVAKAFNINIFWICHNVDKESIENYPFFTKLRRFNLKISSDKIFVTDELLISPCAEILNVKKSKIRAISFGRTDIFHEEVNDTNIQEQDNTLNFIKEWVETKKKEKNDYLFGLWIGSPLDKKFSGLATIPQLIAKNNNDLSKNRFCFIIIGKISSWLKEKDPDLLKVLKESSSVLMIDQAVEIPTKIWPDICSFLWKPYDDLSVPLTAYNAALANLPLVAFKDTFLGQFVLNYKLGIAIDASNDTSIYDELLISLENWQNDVQNQGCKDFLEAKTWDYSANILFDFDV